MLLVVWSVLLLWNHVVMDASIIYIIESFALATCLVSTEVVNSRVQEKENKIYRELLTYFSRVKHCYTACRNVSNAVLDAAENLSYEVRCIANEMHRVLMAGGRKESLREYISCHCANRYIKLFLIQAYETAEKGNFMFLENIEQLRLEIMEELHWRKKRNYQFAGYVFVTVAPFFSMSVLKHWNLEFAPELAFFYEGTGVLLETINFLITLSIYRLIVKEKELFCGQENKDSCSKNYLFSCRNQIIINVIRRLEQADGTFSNAIRKKLFLSGAKMTYGQFCIRILFCTIFGYLALASFFSGIHTREQRIILSGVETIEVIAPVTSEEKKEILSEHILAVTKLCIGKQSITEEEILELLRARIRIGNARMEQEVITTIMDKFEQYEKAKGSFLEWVLCLLGGAMTGWVVLLKLNFQANAVNAGASQEVRRFQTIILMERCLYGITIVELLEDMEVFSGCFRTVLRRCITSYGAGPQEALLRLKEEGGCIHEGFVELADAFLSVDDVGIEIAFAEIENNRRLLDKMEQLEAEIAIERKRDSADLLSKLPMLFAVGVYFVFPFFMYSLQGVYDIFELLEEMQI